MLQNHGHPGGSTRQRCSGCVRSHTKARKLGAPPRRQFGPLQHGMSQHARAWGRVPGDHCADKLYPSQVQQHGAAGLCARCAQNTHVMLMRLSRILSSFGSCGVAWFQRGGGGCCCGCVDLSDVWQENRARAGAGMRGRLRWVAAAPSLGRKRGRGNGKRAALVARAEGPPQPLCDQPLWRLSTLGWPHGGRCGNLGSVKKADYPPQSLSNSEQHTVC